MKKRPIFAVIAIWLCLVPFALAGSTAVQIAEVSCVKRFMQGDDKIKIIRVDDPDNPFITIYFTTIDSGQWMALADPSNTAIAARLTGEIPVDENGNRIIDTSPKDNIASVSKSIGSKVMKIGRYYDQKKDTMTYLVYTTKAIDGSLKHSLSVVPLGKPLSP